MALISKTPSKRFDIPNEPGEWVELLPMSARVTRVAEEKGGDSNFAKGIIALAQCIAAWSYDAPVSVETVEDLDTDTFTWLLQTVSSLSGERGEDEKKDSTEPSSPTTDPVAEPSPESSGISA